MTPDSYDWVSQQRAWILDKDSAERNTRAWPGAGVTVFCDTAGRMKQRAVLEPVGAAHMAASTAPGATARHCGLDWSRADKRRAGWGETDTATEKHGARPRDRGAHAACRQSSARAGTGGRAMAKVTKGLDKVGRSTAPYAPLAVTSRASHSARTLRPQTPPPAHRRDPGQSLSPRSPVSAPRSPPVGLLPLPSPAPLLLCPR